MDPPEYHGLQETLGPGGRRSRQPVNLRPHLCYAQVFATEKNPNNLHAISPSPFIATTGSLCCIPISIEFGGHLRKLVHASFRAVEPYHPSVDRSIPQLHEGRRGYNGERALLQ